MNYYNSASFNNQMSELTLNHRPLTILPYSAYNEYEQQFKETFASTVELKKYIDSIVFASIDTTEEEEETNDQPDQPVQSEQQPAPSTGPSTSPLPGFEPSEDEEPNPELRMQLLLQQLQQTAEIRSDLDDFLQYISSVYHIDLTEPISDLPFEVIDEILTYIDYDPDVHGDLDMSSMFDTESSDSSDTLIIPINQIVEFQNALNQFRFNVKTLKHLELLNAVTNDRCDLAYQRFQQIFKPTIFSLIKLYKTNLHDYTDLLRSSIRQHEQRRQK